MISVRDKNDEEDIERIQCSTTEKMAKKMKTLAKTKDPKINYVDIFMQVPFQQVRFKKNEQHYHSLFSTANATLTIPYVWLHVSLGYFSDRLCCLEK